ncbi:hypothetical protein SDC9_196440 [bioreactor metagenome]|uniref:Uncharacterized protein n=1 Tax=bioreactor metagenome TaxID=1076179 RepID=A0A645IC09_9ZZZZ
MLPVAVGGLIQVHKVHVNFFIGNLPVILGGKMTVGLLQVHKAVNPHFRGTEGVAPGDHSGTAVVVIGLFDHVGNFPVGLGGQLINQRVRQHPAQLRRHLGGAGIHSFQNLGAVQRLAAHHKPKFILFHRIMFSFYNWLTAARSTARPARKRLR